MEALVTKIIKNVHSSSLEEAISQGVCVPVSFDQKLNDSQFYMGVNVEPGHIAAGLVVKNRPLFLKSINY